LKILVAVKRVADPENLNKVKLSASGSVDSTGLEPKASPYDEYALEASLRLTENGATPKQRLGEVVVATFGPKACEQMLRGMLGTGADRAIRVEATDETLDGGIVARGLATLVAQEKPDLVMLGYQQAEHESNEVGQMLAALLGWPQATFAGSIQTDNDTVLTVGREVEGGTAQVRVTLPAVVAVLDKIIHPKSVRSRHTPPSHTYPDGVRFAALMAIMAAKKKPLVEMKLSDLVKDAQPRVRYLSAEMPPKRAAGVRVKDVKELVIRLRTEAKVL
jgi:electron transfer flavoprotein beta subunit